jgi:HEPN domain-containing protein
MQPDRRLIAGYWLEAASGDLIVAEDYLKRLPHVACFHAQQAAEKALKAVVTDIIGDAPRTHVAHQLLIELNEAGVCVPEEIAEAARGLDKFYAPTRYPDALGGASPSHAFATTDASSAHNAAQKVVSWCSENVTDAV